MFFGQLLTDRQFSVVLGVAGIATWTALWVFTFLLAQEEQ